MLMDLPQTSVSHSKRHKIKMLKILGSPLSGIFFCLWGLGGLGSLGSLESLGSLGSLGIMLSR